MRALVATLVLASAAGSGCSDGTYLVVTVTARATVHDVTSLEVTQRNNGTSRTDSLDVDGHTFPATFSISTAGRSGQLELELSGKASDGSIVAVGAASMMIDATDAAVQLDPADFVVNTDYAMDEFLTTDFETVGFQLAATADGSWTAAFRNTCSNTCTLFARTFGADGRPVKTAAAAGTNQYAVSSATSQEGAFPAIAANGTASVAVWDFTDTVGGGTGVACRGIDATGALTAGQRTLTTDPADTAVVSPLPTGNYAVAWQVTTPTAAIHTIITKPDCTTLGTTPLVVTNTVGTTDGPHRASIAANGTAVLYAWITDGAVRVRAASTSGTFSLPESTVVAPPAGQDAESVRVVAMGTGFALAIRYASRTDGMPGQLVLVRTSTTGLAMGAPVLISDKTGSDFTTGHRGFGISTRADGATLIVWGQCDDGSASACDGQLDVYGRLIGPTGDALGMPFVIPTTTVGSQTDPSVVALGDAFAVAWTDGSKAAPDTDGTAVRARVIYPQFP